MKSILDTLFSPLLRKYTVSTSGNRPWVNRKRMMRMRNSFSIKFAIKIYTLYIFKCRKKLSTLDGGKNGKRKTILFFPPPRCFLGLPSR